MKSDNLEKQHEKQKQSESTHDELVTTIVKQRTIWVDAVAELKSNNILNDTPASDLPYPCIFKAEIIDGCEKSIVTLALSRQAAIDIVRTAVEVIL